jgi:hypothetical protein
MQAEATMTWREMVGGDWFAWRGANRGLVLAVWWNVALLVLSAAALPFDHRRILGLNPWVKPIKFEVSVILFLLTMAALLAALGRRGDWPKARRRLAWGFGVAMIVENTIIAMQSARGVRSHMNIATPFDGMAFGVMGAFIAFNTVLVAVLLVLYLKAGSGRGSGLPMAVTWGIALGLAMTLAGSFEGVFMIVRYWGHTVGGKDGGPGLAFVNWSTQHGDMRVAHFFALHALQAFVLAGWGMTKVPVKAWLQTAATVGFAAVYGGAVWAMFEQAVRGEAFWTGR